MTATENPPGRLTEEQLDDLLKLAADSDSVELKLTIPEAEHRATSTALNVDPLDAQIRQVFFFDTPDLALNQKGLVVRARRVQGRGDDTVVKLRPVVPAEVPEHLRQSPNLVVEVDAMPGGYVCSASLKGVPTKAAVKDVSAREAPIRKLFSKEQRAFYQRHAPEGIDMDSLSILGPIAVFKLKSVPPELGRKLVGEMWLYPDYSRILELSTKCAPADALNAAFKTRRFLEERGIDLDGDQQTKTKTALEFFVSKLKP